MRRREFIMLVGGAALGCPAVARAQKPPMPVIGAISPLAPERMRPFLVLFRQGLAEAGYVESKNVVIEYRFANGKPELYREAAGDLVRRNVNVIFAGSPEAVDATRDATTSIPTVALDLERDPVAMGYIENLAHPGGNVTGIYLDLPELSGKQLDLLKQIFPGISRIAIFGVPHLNALQFAAAEAAARALAVEAGIVEVRGADDFGRALGAAAAKHLEAGVLLSSPLVFDLGKQISEIAIAKRIALISLFDAFPKAGGFMAYGPNLAELFRRCGAYVGKILQGTKPGDLPIQRPEKFDLMINLNTAAALGVTVPPLLVVTADEVIE
jgi:putative tryptophan/tyrosine transport system substrate-binding protein